MSKRKQYTAKLIFGTDSSRSLSDPFIVLCIAEQVIVIEETEQNEFWDWKHNNGISFTSALMYGVLQRKKSCKQHYQILLILRALNRRIFHYLYGYPEYIQRAENAFLKITKRVISKVRYSTPVSICSSLSSNIVVQVELKYAQDEHSVPRMRLKEPSSIDVHLYLGAYNEMRVKTFAYRGMIDFKNYSADKEVDDKAYKQLLKIEHLTSDITVI